MKAPLGLWKKLSGAHWEMLGLTVVLFVLVTVFVDLKPVVEENFFFSTSDPGFGQSEKLVARLEKIVHESDTRDFRIHIAGTPYVVEMLKRSITHDFRYFSLTAVVLFGVTMAAMFRSLRIFLGMFATCASAVLLT